MEINLGRPALPELNWAGTPLYNVPSWDSLISAVSHLHREDAQKYLSFYRGHQWYPEILEHRTKAGRPSLVINMLPLIVAASIANAKSGMPSLDSTDKERLIVAVTYLNMDAQRFYNYLASALLELAMLPEVGIRSAE